MTRKLIEHKADIHAAEKGNMRPIHAAATKGHRTVIELLIKHKASPDTPGVLRKQRVVDISQHAKLCWSSKRDQTAHDITQLCTTLQLLVAVKFVSCSSHSRRTTRMWAA